jgi:hypothetical protein
MKRVEFLSFVLCSCPGCVFCWSVSIIRIVSLHSVSMARHFMERVVPLRVVMGIKFLQRRIISRLQE